MIICFSNKFDVGVFYVFHVRINKIHFNFLLIKIFLKSKF
jgi:hypothetical protein